jgi:hypothetical protein
VESFTAVPPATPAGIEHLLGSGLIQGIGKELASRLVSKFGTETLRVIEKEPGKLREVEGVGPLRAERIVEAWSRQRNIREIVFLLQSCGVSKGLAARIFKHYGPGAHEVVRRNPWRLAAEMPGVGFRMADTIAKSLGAPADSPQRIEAGVLFALEERATEGDVMACRQRIEELSAQTGNNLSAWTWRKVAPVTFSHPLGGTPGFRWMNRGGIPPQGDANSVWIHKFDRKDPARFPVLYGPGLRLVVDFNDFPGSIISIPGGESGRPGNRHYADLLPLFERGEGAGLEINPAALRVDAEEMLTLNP